MHLKELKAKNPANLLDYAESLEIENASTLRKQDMMFACLKRQQKMILVFTEMVFLRFYLMALVF